MINHDQMIILFSQYRTETIHVSYHIAYIDIGHIIAEWITLWPGHFFYDFKMPDGRAPRWSRSPGEYS